MFCLLQTNFILFHAFQLISEFSVNAQSTIGTTSNQPISNSTLISSINTINQTYSPTFLSSQSNSNPIGITSVYSSIILSTLFPFTSASPASISSKTILSTTATSWSTNTNHISSFTRQSLHVTSHADRFSSVIYTRRPRPTSTAVHSITTQQTFNTTFKNCACKDEQYIILCILVHFLLFIYPFH
ncbi:unnamed protein product [Adineta ricciae]|uniref:Uncharacterized protein n=1 Tax=Adineta ricciae TaxID=249248 RepID=A0A815HCG7_ADIRI|nr:unnamed protein product [Adineta ricciae]CAF1371094.1 unnamed protein product [Adineta ricciae]